MFFLTFLNHSVVLPLYDDRIFSLIVCDACFYVEFSVCLGLSLLLMLLNTVLFIVIVFLLCVVHYVCYYVCYVCIL